MGIKIPLYGFSIMRSGDYYAALLDEWLSYIIKWLWIWRKILIEEVDKENTTLSTLAIMDNRRLSEPNYLVKLKRYSCNNMLFNTKYTR